MEDKKPTREGNRVQLWPHGLTVEILEEATKEGDGIFALISAGGGSGCGVTGMELEWLCRWWGSYKKEAKVPLRLLE